MRRRNDFPVEHIQQRLGLGVLERWTKRDRWIELERRLRVCHVDVYDPDVREFLGKQGLQVAFALGAEETPDLPGDADRAVRRLVTSCLHGQHGNDAEHEESVPATKSGQVTQVRVGASHQIWASYARKSPIFSRFGGWHHFRRHFQGVWKSSLRTTSWMSVRRPPPCDAVWLTIPETASRSAKAMSRPVP